MTGERLPVADVRAFAAAVAALDRDRPRLCAMSAAARDAVAARFDIRDRVADYQALYVRWRDLYAARGFDKIAHAYLRDARFGYLRWGADAKVRQLESWKKLKFA